LEQVVQDFQEIGLVLTLVTLVLGNLVLFVLDFLLTRIGGRRKR
jgi:hypothetical protein